MGFAAALICLTLCLLSLLLPPPEAFASSGLIAADVPDDDGTAIRLTWTGVSLEGDSLILSRAAYPDTVWSEVATVEAAGRGYTDQDLSRRV
ncbi:MAG: hypothetical protein PVH52_01375, partial [bacterium]